MSTPDISTRKSDHLRLCAEESVEARVKTNLLDDVQLLHDSLPGLAVDDVDMSTSFLGKTIEAPLLISGMTGGTDKAGRINRDLAAVAQEFGLAMGVGSQRAMLDNPSLADTFQLREVAPDIPLLANIGGVQVAQLSPEELLPIIEAIDADGLAIHLNPGQELIQPEGDRDFRGILKGIQRCVEDLSVPVIIKETGCGLSPSVLDRLVRIGVSWVDTAGAGGTTWIGVESKRAQADAADLGELFWDWGTPTGASIGYARRRGLKIIGSGGLRHGLHAATAIALGARMAGMALPWLRAAHDEGQEGARRFARAATDALRTAMVLTGSSDLTELRHCGRIVGPRLQRWLDADPLARQHQTPPRR